MVSFRGHCYGRWWRWCLFQPIQYLIQQGARLDTPTPRGGVTPVHWLGMFVEMKQMHGAGVASPIPLPEHDDLTEESYEACLAWIIQHHRRALFVPDNRGVTALQRLLKRAPVGFIRTAIVHLLSEEDGPEAQ